MGNKKHKPILIKTFKSAYRFKNDFSEKYNLRDLTISYVPSADSICNIYVNDICIDHTARYMDYIIDEKENYKSIIKILVNNILSETLYQMYENITDMLYFKKTDYCKVLRRDIKNMLLEYVDYRREKLMRDKFFKRIACVTSLSRLKELGDDSETFSYFVIPLNGIYTETVEDMILVKSDPRNGYRNIVKRTIDAIMNNDDNFKIFKKEKYIQLTKELTEDLIPHI